MVRGFLENSSSHLIWVYNVITLMVAHITLTKGLVPSSKALFTYQLIESSWQPYKVGTVKSPILAKENGTHSGQVTCPRTGAGWGAELGFAGTHVTPRSISVIVPQHCLSLGQRAGPTSAVCMHRRQHLISFLWRTFRQWEDKAPELFIFFFSWAKHSSVFSC